MAIPVIHTIVVVRLMGPEALQAEATAGGGLLFLNGPFSPLPALSACIAPACIAPGVTSGLFLCRVPATITGYTMS
jgi:hypothetical protein